MVVRSVAVLFVGLVLASVACSAILDLQPPVEPDAGARDAMTVSDGAAPGVDGSGSDAGGCVPGDAGFLLDGAAVPTVWGPVDDSAGAWTWFDTSTLQGAPQGFQGAAFDGRYVYLAPTGADAVTGLVTRYDTQAPFGASGSWSTFDTTKLPTPGGNYAGAVFDGRYVNFVPALDNSAGYSGVVVRYDTTTNDFTAAASWTTFSTLPLMLPSGPLVGFRGGTFDGRYVDFIPDLTPTGRNGRVARFDTQAPTGAHDAGPVPGLSAYDLATQNASAIGYYGSVFDGRFLYLAPFENGEHDNGGWSGWVAQYDTRATFDSPSSWSLYDLSQLPGTQAFGFQGAAFDGTYVYLVPYRQTTVARYDTRLGALDKAAGWSTFDVAPVIGATAAANIGHFSTAGFDGRYLYLVPAYEKFGILVRYDTFSDFSSACAWTAYDLTQVNSLAVNFSSAVYDGRYLYLVPSGSLVMRFDTKNVPSMPALPEFHGSFF